MYRLRFLDSAEKEFEKLDRSVSVRLLRKLTWLAVNADLITEAGLSGDRSNLSKLRDGDYRILYEILHQEKTVIVHDVGHRSEIYKR